MCMTIPVALTSFAEDNERKNLSKETMRYYRENLGRFYAWLRQKGIEKVSKITKPVVDEYLIFLIRTVPNKTSVNTYMRAVRRFINYLEWTKQIKPIDIALLKDPYKIKPTFSGEEVSKILASVRPTDDTSVIMLLLLSTGIRSRSLCELRVQDINFSDGYVDIHYTKNGIPICLPISPDITDVLKEYIKVYARSGTLFLNKCGEKLNRDSLVQRMNKRLAQLGIEKTGVHIFRHTFGKVMSMNACPTATLQKWFGHSDIKTTEKYTRLYGSELRNTMNMTPVSAFQYC